MNAYKVVDGQLVPIGLEEYQQLTEYSEQLVENDSDIQIEKFSQDLSALYGSYYTFTPSSTSTLNAPIEKASASINCTVKICTVSKIYNTTYSKSFTAGLTADAKSTIKLNAGFTWVKSATNGSSYSFTVEKGVSGYIGFNAYYRKTTGVLQEYIENLPAGRKVVEGRAPKTLSTGELDGIYSWVYTN